MAKAKERGEHPEDTNAHASTIHVGQFGHKSDQLMVIGEGVYLSRHAVHEMERSFAKQNEAHGGERYEDKYHKMLIPERQIESWHREIQKNKEMTAARDRHREEYQKGCYPGTDAEDPTKKTGPLKDGANSFSLDRSQSTISLSMASGNRYLNGSSVMHQNYVNLSVHSPDGRELVEVAMTFDQFASFLCSNMATSCTVDTYWSVTDDCLRLQEVVKEPDSIHERMAQRLNNRLDGMRERIATLQRELDEQAASGKAMSKTKVQEVSRQLEIFSSHFDSNRDFTVLQAKEEVSSIVEQAAATIAWNHKLSNEELLANPHVRSMLTSWMGHKTVMDKQNTEKLTDQNG